LRATLILLFLCLACSPKRIALNSVADALSSTGDGGAFARDDDPELIAQAVPFALKTMESLSDSLDDHVGLRLAMARGFTQYGYAFVQQPGLETMEGDKQKHAIERALRLYLRARGYGLDGLKLARGVTEAQLRGSDAERTAALARLTKEDVPLLYWTFVPWAAAIAANKRNLELVGDVPVVAAMLDRALALDESYDLGALHEFSITFDPARAEGTTPEKQKQHFERALALAKGEKISALVTYAESVLAPAQQKKEFEGLLNQALKFDVDQPKVRNQRLANVLSQRHAAYLLAHEGDLFSD
jgi:hypothetical protein